MKANWTPAEAPGVLTLELSRHEAKVLRQFFGRVSGVKFAAIANDGFGDLAVDPLEGSTISSAIYNAIDK